MVAASRPGMRQPLNPPQTAQLLGGSPPGMAPPNAFDLDPNELDRMLASGWTMYDDGTMAPPPTAGQLPLPGGDEYGAGGYATAGPTDGAGPMLGGNSAPAPPVLGPPAPPDLGGVPPLDGGIGTAPLPGDPNAVAAPTAAPGPDLGLPGVLPPVPATPTPGPVGPGLLPPSPGIGAGAGPLPPLTGGAESVPAGPPPLDPFAYTAEQNRRSLTPGGGDSSVGADPGGYVGGDVARFDPTKLLPSRRRTDRNGSTQRLNTPDPGMARSFQPRPRRRP